MNVEPAADFELEDQRESCAGFTNLFGAEPGSAIWLIEVTIGDSPQDVEAARCFGGLGCLVRTGWAADDKVVEEARASAAFIGETITDAVDWILSKEQVNCEQAAEGESANTDEGAEAAWREDSREY